MQKDIAKIWREYLEILYKGEILKENETNEEKKTKEKRIQKGPSYED